MRYRTYKNSDLSVSEVGFGLWTISTGWWEISRKAKRSRSCIGRLISVLLYSMRRRISMACASVGALESGFTVDP